MDTAAASDKDGKAKEHDGLNHQEYDLEAGGPAALDKSESLGDELKRRGLRITFQVSLGASAIVALIVNLPTHLTANCASQPLTCNAHAVHAATSIVVHW